MDNQTAAEWWLGRLYREIATFVYEPSPETEAKILSMIEQYRLIFEETYPSGDEHERVMNFR